MSNDPFRRLAMACAVLSACGVHASEDMWAKADDAFNATPDFASEAPEDDTKRYASERMLLEAFTLARMSWAHKAARDLLWAAVQLYGIFRSSRHDSPAPEASPEYWWEKL